MKKKYKFIFFISALMCLLFLVYNTCSADNYDDEIKVMINDEPVQFEANPQMVDERVMVPMRAVFEALGGNIEWHADSQCVIDNKNDIKVAMQINNAVMTKNDIETTLDVAPQIIDDRTYVPVRAIAECFNADVSWDEGSQTVYIYTNPLATNTSVNVAWGGDMCEAGGFIYYVSNSDDRKTSL